MKIRSKRRTCAVNESSRDRLVPIATLEQALLLDFALRHAPGTGETMFPTLGNIRRDMHLAADRARVKRFSPHTLRHTLGKWLRAGGVDSATTGALLGHADGRMVERIYGRLDNPEDARSAIAAQFMGRFWYGNGGGSGAPGHPWQNDAGTEAAVFPADAVRRGGIEPPTRGFSVPPNITDLPEKNAVPNVPRGGFGAATDPDEAVRTAIKAAVDAGRFELAARLLDVLREAPKPGAVVRLETAKRGC